MRTISIALLVLGLAVVGCKKRGEPTDSGDTKDKGSPQGGAAAGTPGKRGTFTVGKTTTYVTTPVDATGHIDYATALNERLAKGVTAENNANVAIWKVLGPNPPGGGKVPAGFFEKMGMQTPPATGEYFVGLKQYAERNGGNANAAFDAMKRYSERPWTTTENATLNNWLQANHKALTALREAVKKTHYYNPLIPERSDKGSKGIMSSLLPGPQACREIAGAFAARAMLFLGHNQVSDAWEDLLACHRLGRLVGLGGTLIEGLVGMAIEQIACRGDVAFLDRAKPDAKSIEACLKDLRALPPMPEVADKIDSSERFSLLDQYKQLDLQGVAYLTAMTDGQPAAPPAFGDNDLAGIDWNPALESVNKWFDRMSAIAREKDRATRVQKWTQLESEIRTLKARFDGGVGGTLLKTAKTPAERGQILGDIFTSLMLPAAGKVMDAHDRAFQTHENVIVAFACAWYQRFNNRYPNTLADLAPTYLTQVPTDIFSGHSLIYKQNASGFVLYSVGINGRDDGGRGYDSQPQGDDLAVQIPQPAKP